MSSSNYLITMDIQESNERKIKFHNGIKVIETEECLSQLFESHHPKNDTTVEYKLHNKFYEADTIEISMHKYDFHIKCLDSKKKLYIHKYHYCNYHIENIIQELTDICKKVSSKANKKLKKKTEMENKINQRRISKSS